MYIHIYDCIVSCNIITYIIVCAYISLSLSISLSMCIYIYIYTHMHVYIYIYIHIHITLCRLAPSPLGERNLTYRLAASRNRKHS